MVSMALAGFQRRCVYDIRMRCRYFLPVKPQDAIDTLRELRYVKEPDTIELVNSIKFTSIVKACQELRVIHELSQPGVPQSNGQIEGRNGDVLCGIRAALSQAGLPSCLWP